MQRRRFEFQVFISVDAFDEKHARDQVDRLLNVTEVGAREAARDLGFSYAIESADEVPLDESPVAGG